MTEPPSVARSVSGTPIRLSAERWFHIQQGHPEFAGFRDLILATVRDPIRVYLGHQGEHLAVRQWTHGKYCVVVYREMSEDGFVITAYPTSQLTRLNRLHQLWPLH